MTTITNAKLLRQYKSSISLILEQLLASDLSTNQIREVEDVSPYFKLHDDDSR